MTNVEGKNYRRPPRRSASTCKHGKCQRCEGKSRDLTLACTRETEGCRHFSWVCGKCGSDLAIARAAREEALKLRLGALGSSQERREARRIRRDLSPTY